MTNSSIHDAITDRMSSDQLHTDTEGELPRVLVVDDEVHILKAVRRLFLGRDVQVFTAHSGDEAIEILNKMAIAVVVSDQRMPGLSGAELLKHCRQHYPSTVRIMLTGNNDVLTAIEAINHGEVFRFVTKPWDHEDFLTVMDAAIEQHELQRTHQRYQQFVQEQNDKLLQLNEELESRVEERSAEVVARQLEVASLYKELEVSFDATIKALLSIMELGDIHIVEHCQRTATRALALASIVQLDEGMTRHLERAALLHWLGLINAPAALFKKPIASLNAEEQATWEFHPLLGQQAIAHVPVLDKPGKIILNYLRRFDDKDFRPGKPSDTSDDATTFDANIIVACRILNICSTFERPGSRLRRQGGGERAVFDEGLDMLKQGSGSIFDPELVNHFQDMVSHEHIGLRSRETAIALDKLRAGMVLSRPLETAQGIPVAPRDMIITEELIQRLRRFRDSNGLNEIFVWA